MHFQLSFILQSPAVIALTLILRQK